MSSSPKHTGHKTDPANGSSSSSQTAAGGHHAQPEQVQLSPADMARVEKYLASPAHRVERKPFRPWLMMLALLAVVVGLSLASILISWLVL